MKENLDILNLSNCTHHVLSHKIFWVLIEVYTECLDDTFSSQINVIILARDKQSKLFG